jgi:hypothetical protein
MATYEVSLHEDGKSYVSEGGARQTMLGFRSEEEAAAWITVDRLRGRININQEDSEGTWNEFVRQLREEP